MQKSIVLLLVMALASAGVSAGLWFELRAERALNAELSERLKVATATLIAPAPAPVASPTAEPPTAIAPVVATATPTPELAPAPADPLAAKAERVSTEDRQNRQRQLMSDPRYREALREQQRLRLATRREDFIRLLGFSPEQADAVIDLSVETQLRREPNSMTAEDNEQKKARMEADERAYQAKLREMLGEEKSTQLRTYMESRSSRMAVDRFRTQLTGVDTLRDDQVEPLIAALHTEHSQMQKNIDEYRETLSWEGNATASSRQVAERRTELMKAALGGVHSAASGILSNSQLRKLDAMLKRDLDRLEAQQRMARIRSELKQSSGSETAPD